MSIVAGQQLRRIREQLGLSMRDVEAASSSIAARFENEEFLIAISRLSDIESKGVLPSIFKLFSLSAIYGRDQGELCALYGVDWGQIASARQDARVPKTHIFNALRSVSRVEVPTVVDPGFDVRRTTNVVRMIQKWGAVPASFVAHMAASGHTYGFIGTEDLTMYPLVMPGSFVQVDETRNRVTNDGWRSEYERPLYFIETREEFICAWCKVSDGLLMIQPHPLSPSTPRVFRYPQQAEVIGQVVGIAMRLDDWKPESFGTGKKPHLRLNSRPNSTTSASGFTMLR